MSFARRLAKRSIGRWIWLETYRCLRLPWQQAQRAAAAMAAPTGAIEFRLVPRSELQRYAEADENDVSARFVSGLASRGDLCYGAFAEGKLVSYCFFALMPTAIDSDLRFHFPPRWVYAYKAFTQPAWRGKRLQQKVFLRAVPEIGRWVHGMREPLGFVTLVVADNSSSLNAFARLGFTPFASLPVLRISSRPRLVSRPDDEGSAFYVRKQET